MKITDDHCPTCDHPIEVFVPQPYASGPELLEVLEYVKERTFLGSDGEWHFKVRYDPKRVKDIIAKAKGETNG